MFRKISVAVVALAATAALAVTASPASALRSMDPSGEDTTYSYEPTGTRTVYAEKPHGGYETGDTDEGCIKAVRAANSWQIEAMKKFESGDASWQQAQNNADNIAGEANKGGCTLTHPE